MRASLVAAAALLLALTALPPAGAALYGNSGFHYHFEAPDGWPRVNTTRVDAAFVEPHPAGFAANFNAAHQADLNASGEPGALRAFAAASLESVRAKYNGTVVQGARSFTTGGGRVAADYVLDYTTNGQDLRIRQVVFASSQLKLEWYLTFTAARSSFDGYAPAWDAVTDSFGVDGESPAAAGPSAGDGWLFGLPLPLTLVAAGAAAGAGAGALVYRRARRRRAASREGPLPVPANRPRAAADGRGRPPSGGGAGGERLAALKPSNR